MTDNAITDPIYQKWVNNNQRPIEPTTHQTTDFEAQQYNRDLHLKSMKNNSPQTDWRSRLKLGTLNKSIPCGYAVYLSDLENMNEVPFIANERKLWLEEVKALVEKQKLGTYKEWIKATKQYGGTREEWEKLNNRGHDRVIDDLLKALEKQEQ